MHEHHVHGLLSFSVALLLGAGVFVFSQNGFVFDMRSQSAQVNAVGMAVGVGPNELNTLAQELKSKEEALRTREEQSLIRERWLAEKDRASSNATLYLGLGGIILLLLIMSNFYFEYAVHQKDKKEIEALAAEVRHGFEV